MAEADLTFGLKREGVRKLIHLLAISAIVADFFLSKELLLTFGIIFCIAYLAAEYFRFKGEKIAFITDLIKYCARGRELEKWVLTPFYIILSITILIGISGVIITKNAAYVGIVAATIGDASAAIFGKRFGRHSHWILKGKSVEGTFAFFVMTFLSSIFFVHWQTALMVAVASAVVEIFSGGFDNLTVPFSAAILASIL